MKIKGKRKKVALVLFVVALITLVWIFGNSLKDGASSTEQSSKMMAFLRPVIDKVLSLFDVSASDTQIHHFVRKAAHFSEYALLGFLLMGAMLVFRFSDRKAPLVVFPVCLLAAAIDESLQVFSPGRGPSRADVLLDFCGAVFGIGCACLLLLLLSAILKKKNGSMG